MKKIAFVLLGILWLFFPIEKPQGQFVVFDPTMASLKKADMLFEKIRHAEQLNKIIMQINEARRTVKGIREVKQDIERTYDFVTSLVNLADLRAIKEFDMRNSIECLVGFSFDPREYMPRLNRNRNRYFIGCPSIETALMMIDDLESLSSRYGWEKMMQQKSLMQSQYMYRLIEQMKKTNERMEKELANQKNEMTRGEYLSLLQKVEERNADILGKMLENQKMIAQATEPTEIEKQILQTKYQQTLLLENLSFSLGNKRR